jgi:hypothetical protein
VGVKRQAGKIGYMLENKEKKKISWVVTDGVERFGAWIFSDKVLKIVHHRQKCLCYCGVVSSFAI